MDGDVLGDSWDEVDEIGAPAAEEPLASLSLPTAFLSEGYSPPPATRLMADTEEGTPPGRRRFSPPSIDQPMSFDGGIEIFTKDIALKRLTVPLDDGHLTPTDASTSGLASDELYGSDDPRDDTSEGEIDISGDVEPPKYHSEEIRAQAGDYLRLVKISVPRMSSTQVLKVSKAKPYAAVGACLESDEQGVTIISTMSTDGLLETAGAKCSDLLLRVNGESVMGAVHAAELLAYARGTFEVEVSRAVFARSLSVVVNGRRASFTQPRGCWMARVKGVESATDV